jgi:ADP-ribosylglycohydrolase
MHSAEAAFELGAEAAAITHGHPTGYLAGGALSAMTYGVLRGATLHEATEITLKILHKTSNSEETIHALLQAIDLAESSSPSPEHVERLGGGWVAEEALSIALYCALSESSPLAALLLAVNHSGDSDSTGAICGSMVGARVDDDALPQDLLSKLEAREIIEHVADDLYEVFGEHAEPDWTRYPGW